jgi:glyoxylase I family protein
MIPFEIRKLDHVVLRVRSLERSLSFYVNVLGCVIEKRQDALGLVHLRAGLSLIDLVPVDGPLGSKGGAAPAREGRNVDHFALQIAPYDETAIRAHLTRFGVEIGESGQRYGADGEGPSLYLYDPDGNMVELKGPASANDRYQPASSKG